MPSTPVSPTFTGPLPKLEIDLTACEAGDPCRAAVPARLASERVHALRGHPAYVCRIHRVREFFRQLGWVE